MSSIRKQTILSSLLIYASLPFASLNTYFFVKQGSFTSDEYGLTRLFFDIGTNFYIIASLGVIPIIYKFYPYYKDNLHDKENDLLGRTFLKALIGFILLTIACFVLQPLIEKNFGEHSKLFVDYYFWVLPYAFGMLLFSLLEGYSWALQKTVLPNFLRDAATRLITTLFILAYIFGFVRFHTFIILFSSLYVIITIVMVVALAKTGNLHFTLKVSRVSKKFRKKIFKMQSLVFGNIVVNTLGSTVNGIIIASLLGLTPTAIYSLALHAANLIQIPQQSLRNISLGVLVRSWKDKDYSRIKDIYQRSSINMLLLTMLVFGNAWLNAADGLKVLHIQDEYTAGIPLLLVFGIIRIIDAGMGINGQIIGASTFWRFDVITSIVMISLRIPLSYFFIKEYGIMGSTYADLISLTVYNYIRMEFLRRKIGMQPFTVQTIYSLMLALAGYFIAYILFYEQSGWFAIIARSTIFSGILIGGTLIFKLTPDVMQLYGAATKKLKFVKVQS